jgi:hypothetical protein
MRRSRCSRWGDFRSVEKVFPKWVGEDKAGNKTLGIPARELAALEVEAFRTLKAENDARKAENAELREQVRAIANGEHPNVGGPRFNFNQLGWFVSGVLATLFWVSRRKRAPQTV